MLEDILTILLLIIFVILGITMLMNMIYVLIKSHREYKIEQNFKQELEKLTEGFSKFGVSTTDTTKPKKVDYNTMNLQELKTLGKQRGIKQYYRLGKSELIKELEKEDE